MPAVLVREGAQPATPSEGFRLWTTVATPSIAKLIDDAGIAYSLALLEKTQTFTGATTINKLVLGIGATLTIASGVVTVTHSIHSIDTEAAGATDDLDTINGGTAGQILIIGTVASARDVVLKHGTGNLLLDGGVDFSLLFTRYRCKLVYDGANWVEIGRSD